MKTKKLISLLLSVVMVFSTLSVSVVATDEKAVTQTSVSDEINAFSNKSYNDNNSISFSIRELFHNFFGNILAIFGIECPFCDMIHGEFEADAYYRKNSQLVEVIDVVDSSDMMTEEDVKTFLEGRGFVDCTITYDYSVAGEFTTDTEISETSQTEHPMYQLLYLSAAREVWAVYVINGEIFANPLSFNLESDLDSQLLVTESTVFTSYDNTANKFYITIPYDSEISSVFADEINAETLDGLTIEKLCELTGATFPVADDISVESNSSEVFTISENSNEVSMQTVIESAEDPMIVVSMGDSYSSGEGIEDFYGQGKSVYEKVKDHDWLAHRSKNSWPGLLEIPGISGTLSEYKAPLDGSSTSACQWYFVAASGAETKHFSSKQKKEYDQITNITTKFDLEGEEYLEPQLSVFDRIAGEVDYVTMTIGGNDVGFTKIVITCAIHCKYLHFGATSKLEEIFDDLWDNFDKTEKNLENAFKSVAEKAGPQAEIIVAGYPQLFSPDGKGLAINEAEANLVNHNVSLFNQRIMTIVNRLSKTININFVDVETAFTNHAAYSSKPWINGIMLVPHAQDLKHDEKTSAYSMHPNADGAKAYADCVNAKIRELETGTLSGKICKATDKSTPIANARIVITNNDTRYENEVVNVTTNTDGNYSVTVPAGTYKVKVTADGYIDFNAYADVKTDQVTYTETFLMVAGNIDETGTATGTITNALNGSGLSGVTLQVRNGWNNSGEGSVIKTVRTDSNGRYSVSLPIGNYTLCASKDGYVSTVINIIVQSGTSSEKNGSMTPVASGDSFRIVLTWGNNPSDLDSHVVGTLSNGNSFHVYYADKYVYDRNNEICNLDVDDTSSYGPETITLKTTTDSPYYYYIHRYAGSGSISTSGAQVKVYQGNRLVASFNAPTDQGEADYWNVFAINNGRIIVKNTVTGSPNIIY